MDCVSEEPDTLIIQDESEAKIAPANDSVLANTYHQANESLVQQPELAIEESTQLIDTPCFIYIDEPENIPEIEISSGGSRCGQESSEKRARDESQGSSVQSADSPSQAKRRRKQSAQEQSPLKHGPESDTYQIAEEVQFTLKHILEVIPQLQEREIQGVEEKLLDIQRIILETRRSR